MRLLILTQKVDKNDDLLGFFHGWLVEFAKHSKQIIVICLYEGEHELPGNVSVYSLGKERLSARNRNTMIYHSVAARVLYALRFYRYVWRFRREYDVVFVHMNAEYVALGGVLWKMWGKRVNLWHNHKKGSVWLRLSHALAHRIFYTSQDAYSARYSHAHIMPAGIDTAFFRNKPDITSQPQSILFLGRISPVKHVDVLVDTLTALEKENVSFHAAIYGDALPYERTYEKEVRDRAQMLVQKGRLTFHASVPHHRAVDVYNKHAIFVNVTQEGSLDKTLFEAMACERFVVTCNRAFEHVLHGRGYFTRGKRSAFAEVLKRALLLPESERVAVGKELREYVEKEHSVRVLFKRLIRFLEA